MKPVVVLAVLVNADTSQATLALLRFIRGDTRSAEYLLGWDRDTNGEEAA